MFWKTFSRQEGFTLVELLITVTIVTVAMSLSISVYRMYQLRSDLRLVSEQTVQVLRRAQFLSRSGQDAAVWGYSVPRGVLFRGATYAQRDSSVDELYPMPPTIQVSGMLEVSFSRVGGAPSGTGDIVLESLSGERRTVTVGYDGVLTLR